MECEGCKTIHSGEDDINVHMVRSHMRFWYDGKPHTPYEYFVRWVDRVDWVKDMYLDRWKSEDLVYIDPRYYVMETLGVCSLVENRMIDLSDASFDIFPKYLNPYHTRTAQMVIRAIRGDARIPHWEDHVGCTVASALCDIGLLRKQAPLLVWDAGCERRSGLECTETLDGSVSDMILENVVDQKRPVPPYYLDLGSLVEQDDSGMGIPF